MSVPEIETARELATHANDIKHLQDDMDAMKEDVAAIRKSIEEINKTLSEARGGWKVLIWAGSAASGLSALVGFFSGKWSS
jgi:prefoldin subunit 5